MTRNATIIDQRTTQQGRETEHRQSRDSKRITEVKQSAITHSVR